MKDQSPLLSVVGLEVHYKLPGSWEPLRAVDGVSFDIHRGEIVGLIGESGSGKTSVARAIMRLAPVSNGSIALGGTRLDELSGRELRRQRRRVQMVFQDSQESLDPRMSVRQIVAEPMKVGRSLSHQEIHDRVLGLVNRVGLDESHLDRKPHTLSGGQRQRVNIARAIALDPELLVCDEAVSALDVSVQAGILNLLLELQDDLGISVLFIAHDLGVVAHLADRVGVMYLGQLVEVAPVANMISRPRHPYTEALLASEPEPRPASDRTSQPGLVEGDVPSAANPPSGCRFRTRCVYATERCTEEVPNLDSVSDSTLVACHFAEELVLTGRRPQ